MAARENKSNSVMKVISFFLQLSLNVIFYIIVILLIIMLTQKAYHFSYEISVEEEPGHDRSIKISKGESTLDVAKVLELNGLIVNKYSFFVKAKLSKQVIMPGKYIINSSMTYDEIFDVITNVATEDDEESTE
jgi:UPF0755 protein